MDVADWVREGRHWVLTEDDTWVAFGRLHDLGSGEGWLSGARVRSDRRGSGIGTRLLAHQLDDARSIGLNALRAVVEDENLPSRRLFDRFGFRTAAELTLRRGSARADPAYRLTPVAPDRARGDPIGWLPAMVDRVDLLPGSDGGRFGRWRPELLDRWAREGKLYSNGNALVAVQVDWWTDPRTMWVNPLRGDPPSLLRAVASLAQSLHHAEWQGFFPLSEPFLTACAADDSLLPPRWGERVRLYELVPERS